MLSFLVWIFFSFPRKLLNSLPRKGEINRYWSIVVPLHHVCLSPVWSRLNPYKIHGVQYEVSITKRGDAIKSDFVSW